MERYKMNDNYITISQYAEIKGISKQAVYKQLNTKLQPFLIEVENKKFLKIEVLTAEEREKLNEVEQPNEQPFNNQFQPFLQAQIEEKDKLIQNLLKQIESLQEQNTKLTDLLQNSQILLATEKQLYLESEKNKKEKKSFWNIFRRK